MRSVEEPDPSTAALQLIAIIPVCASVGDDKHHDVVEEEGHEDYHDEPKYVEYYLFGVGLPVCDVDRGLFLHTDQRYYPKNEKAQCHEQGVEGNEVSGRSTLQKLHACLEHHYPPLYLFAEAADNTQEEQEPHRSSNHSPPSQGDSRNCNNAPHYQHCGQD